MKQKTAVEFLISKLGISEITHSLLFKNALQMEKQQITDAYESGQNETANGYYIRLGEQFYNRNYDKTN